MNAVVGPETLRGLRRACWPPSPGNRALGCMLVLLLMGSQASMCHRWELGLRYPSIWCWAAIDPSIHRSLGIFFSLVLLRYNWHIALLLVSGVQRNDLIYDHCKMISTSLVNTCHLKKLAEFFSYKISSLSHCVIYNTVLLMIVTMLYSTYPDFIL